MFCQNCGAELKDGAKFCSECGAKVEAPVQVPAPHETPKETPAEPENDNGFSLALTSNILSQLGLTFAWFPYTALIGLVLSIIARVQIKKFRNAGYQIGGEGLARKAKVSGIFAKIADILSIVGLIVSIVCLAIVIVIIVIMCVVGGYEAYRAYR